jgi:hypothetical protein
MFFTAKKLANTTVGAALLVALMLSTPVLAGSEPSAATLAQNEHAAQRTISDTPAYDRFAPSGQSVETTLTHNEHAAQRAIADTSSKGRVADIDRDSAVGKATLLHNEFAAQRAIAAAPTYGDSKAVVRSTAPASPVASTDRAAAR